jgi:hypothetical protein
VLTAALGELPLAIILMRGTLRMVRLTLTSLPLLDPATHSWRAPLSPQKPGTTAGSVQGCVRTHLGD